MKVSALLDDKGTEVVTISPTATVGEAVGLLARKGIGALVVSEDGERILGIVSERDVVRRLHTAAAGITALSVGELMSTAVHTCTPDDDIESLMRTMTDRRVRHVPVVVAGKLAGLVSIGDVVKRRIVELERDRRELLDYITAR